MVDIFHEQDGDLSVLENKTISIIGYGNQGRAQALNLRDSGLNVIVGNIEDNYKKIALKDKFSVYSIKEATEKSDIIFLLIPDEIMNDTFKKEINPNMKPKTVLVFASGYNIGFNLFSICLYIFTLLSLLGLLKVLASKYHLYLLAHQKSHH